MAMNRDAAEMIIESIEDEMATAPKDELPYLELELKRAKSDLAKIQRFENRTGFYGSVCRAV